MKMFDMKGIIQLASDTFSLQYHARARLLLEFKACLEAFGLSSSFYEALATHDAVISGSFVLWFLDDARKSKAIKDVDVFVGRGRLDDFLVSLHQMFDARLIVLSSTTRPRSEQETAASMGHDIHYYTNSAILSVVRLRLEGLNGESTYVDVVESTMESSLAPILAFDLSHLRACLLSEGYFDFHPVWHRGMKTYVGPAAFSHTEDHSLLPGAQTLFDKYQSLGYDIVDRSTVVVMEDEEGHVCYDSYSCPLTLRSTTDGGVRFVPFTELAATRLFSDHLAILGRPPIRWRHGGCCAKSGSTVERPEVYEEEWTESGSPLV